MVSAVIGVVRSVGQGYNISCPAVLLRGLVVVVLLGLKWLSTGGIGRLILLKR